MRLLVVGKQGQLARALAQSHNPDNGLHVKCVGRPEVDLLHPGDIKSAIASEPADVIVNAAAYTAVDKAESEPEAAMTINRDAAAEIARAAHLLGVPVVHVSTDYVFSGKKPGAYVETDETGPIGVYGRSKLAGEIAVRHAAPRHAILRTSWVYSPHGHNFVKTMLRLAGERDTLRVVDDQRGCPTSAQDLAQAAVGVAVAMKRDAAISGTFHVAGTGETTWAGFASEIMSVARGLGKPAATIVPIGTKDYPTPAARPANSSLDCSKLKQVFGLELPRWQDSTAKVIAQL